MKIYMAITIFLVSQTCQASEFICDGLNEYNGIKFRLDTKKYFLSFIDESNSQLPFPKDFISQQLVSDWLPIVRFDRISDCTEKSEVKNDSTLKHSFKCEMSIARPGDVKMESSLEIAPDKKTAIYYGTINTGIEAKFNLQLGNCL